MTNPDHKAVGIKIMDMTGKIIAQRDYDIDGTVQLPVVSENFAKGIYVVTLTIGDKIQQQKLVVQ